MKNKEKIEIPENIKQLGGQAQILHIKREQLRNELDVNPIRYLTIHNLRGKEKIIDCKSGQATIKKQIVTFCGTSERLRKDVSNWLSEAKERREYIQVNYYNKVAGLTKQINVILAQHGELHVLENKGEEIIELLGKYTTVEEVLRMINEDWGYVLPEAQLKRWILEKSTLIEQKKVQYLESNRDFKVAHEAGRLEILNKHLIYFQRRFEEKPSESLSKTIQGILEQARKEVKGDQLKLTVDGKIDINATLHGQENIQAISKRLPINMLVVGLVAAKKGIDPTSIMASLATSYYSKFNGFNGAVDPNAEIQSPVNLIKNYDWGELERKNKQQNESIRPITDITEYKEVEKEEEAKKTKQSLLDSLKKA